MIKVLIVEDEIPSQLNLQRALTSMYDDIEIVDCFTSVKEVVNWSATNAGGADLIFMDVQLSDGLCFDIFKYCNITAQVIITTAYDNYALDAFKVHSIDYLLKPLDKQALYKAVEHCRSLTAHRTIDYAKLAELFAERQKPQAKERFVVKVGDKIIVVRAENINYFYSESKATYLVTDENREYVIDDSLDTIETQLDKHDFFRICRSHIVSFRSIATVSKHFGSRLKIQLKKCDRDDLFVSRARAAEFIEWLNGA